MRRILLFAVFLVFVLNAFPFSQPAAAYPRKIPRGFDLYSEYTVGGCTYQLMVRLYEYTKGFGSAFIDLDGPCLSESFSLGGGVERNEFNINGSLKAARLNAAIPDPSTGRTAVLTNLRLTAVGNQPSSSFNPALVSGTVIIPELNVTFTFHQAPIGGIWYGT